MISRCLMRIVPALAAAGLLLGAPTASAQTLVPVNGPFTSPVYATAPPGDGRRLMVVEQGGTVRVVRDGTALDTPFLTMDSNFTTGGERGLMSIAFRPDYEISRLLYAYYTDAEGDIRVDEFRRAADSRDRVEPGYRREVIEVPHREAANHNGGTIAFGPDGYLYIATGDGGNGYDQPNRDARNPASLLGKLLRIAPTPGGRYTTPPGNPYAAAGDPGRDEVWSIGLRNPFRFSFGRVSGDLFIGDVGQSAFEEINRLPAAAAGAGRGANLGWDDCEGSLAAEPVTGTAPCGLTGDVRPELAHPQTNGFCAITGGVVVRDSSVPELAGRYLYGDLCKSRLRSYVPGAPATDREESSLTVASVVGFGEDACGRVYAVQLGGAVARLAGAGAGECALRVAEPGAGGTGGGGGTGSGTGGGGSSGGGFTPVAPTPSPSLRLTLGGPRRQGLGSRGPLVRVRCSEPCAVRAFGTLSLRRGRKRIRLRQVLRSLPANRTVSLRLKVSAGSREAVRRALARRRSVTGRMTVRARDSQSNLRVASRSVRLGR